MPAAPDTIDGEALLSHALHKTHRRMLWAAPFIAGMGALLVWLGATGADPTATAGLDLGVGAFGAFCVAVAVLLAYVGRFRGPARARELMVVVRNSPEQITHLWAVLIGPLVIPPGGGPRPRGQHVVGVRLENGSTYQMTVSETECDALLAYLCGRAPSALQKKP